MKLSVLITVYNRPEMLTACLRALACQASLPDEVVVSDDGSDAEAVQLMQASFGGVPFPVRWVSQPHEGYRLSSARNNAIRAATGDYLVSLDCDVLLLPEVLDVHRRQAAPRRFLVGNRAHLDAPTTRAILDGAVCSRESLEHAWRTADRTHLRKTHQQFMRNVWRRRIGLAARHKPKILGCHFSLFKADMERVNGFDEHFVGWGLEDDDFSLRLHQAGIKGHSVIPVARAMHLWHAPVPSYAEHPSDNPNWDYFNRADIPTACQCGLRK